MSAKIACVGRHFQALSLVIAYSIFLRRRRQGYRPRNNFLAKIPLKCIYEQYMEQMLQEKPCVVLKHLHVPAHPPGSLKSKQRRSRRNRSEPKGNSLPSAGQPGRGQGRVLIDSVQPVKSVAKTPERFWTKKKKFKTGRVAISHLRAQLWDDRPKTPSAPTRTG